LYPGQRDEWELQKRMLEEMQRDAEPVGAYAKVPKTESKPVPPPEPNKVLLLLGDDE
jgi:hypothetical protein